MTDIQLLALILDVTIGSAFGNLIGNSIGHHRYGSAIVALIGLICFIIRLSPTIGCMK